MSDMLHVTCYMSAYMLHVTCYMLHVRLHVTGYRKKRIPMKTS